MTGQAAPSMISFDLPGPVRGWGRPVPKIHGKFPKQYVRMYVDDETRAYKERLAFFARQAMGNRPLITGPIQMMMEAIFVPPQSAPKKRVAAMLAQQIYPTGKPDADNIAKMKDALNGVVWRDDAQVVTETTLKMYGLEPRLRVIIMEKAPKDLLEAVVA